MLPLALIFLLLFGLPLSAEAGACGTISSCPPATSLTGNEFVPIVRNGDTARRLINVRPTNQYVSDFTTFGALCNGTTDDTSAINAALNWSAANNLTVTISGQCYSASGVTAPGGASVSGVGYTAGNPYTGPAIICAAAVTKCLTVQGGTGTNYASVYLEKFAITRASGSIPSGSIGVYVDQSNHVDFVDMTVNRHDQCYQFFINSSGGFDGTQGYGAVIERGFIYQCRDTYINAVGWDEIKVHATRFGYVNAKDFAANSIFRVTGGTTTCPTGIGPNTIQVDQVNIVPFGSNSVNYLWEFKNVVTSDGCHPDIFRITASHIEQVNNIVYADGTPPSILQFWMADCDFAANNNTTDLFNINPSVNILQWFFHHNSIYVASGSGTVGAIGPATKMIGFDMDDNTWDLNSGSVSIVAPSGASGNVTGNVVAVAGETSPPLAISGFGRTGLVGNGASSGYNGWVVLPGGEIQQWGRLTATSGTSASLFFPVTCPTQLDTWNGTNGGGDAGAIWHSSDSASGLTVNWAVSGAVSISWNATCH